VLKDNPKNTEQLAAGGQRVIVLTNSTNRTVPGFRADSWAEAEALLLQEVAIRKRGVD
jgi:hypothetical protein